MTFSVSRLALALLVFVAVCAASAASRSLPDLAQNGPYAVGFEYFQLTDTTRDVTIGGRPIAVYLFYPVDSTSITSSTPKALYPLDPYFSVIGSTTSDQWEKYGIGAAYQQPPLGAAKPFP